MAAKIFFYFGILNFEVAYKCKSNVFVVCDNFMRH